MESPNRLPEVSPKTRCNSLILRDVFSTVDAMCDRPPGLFEWAFGPRNPMKNWHHDRGGAARS
jgi:hypothetical protein